MDAVDQFAKQLFGDATALTRGCFFLRRWRAKKIAIKMTDHLINAIETGGDPQKQHRVLFYFLVRKRLSKM